MAADSWTGASADAKWATPGHWNLGYAPTADDFVDIGSISSHPAIGLSANIGALDDSAFLQLYGATFDARSGTIQVDGFLFLSPYFGASSHAAVTDSAGIANHTGASASDSVLVDSGGFANANAFGAEGSIVDIDGGPINSGARGSRHRWATRGRSRRRRGHDLGLLDV